MARMEQDQCVKQMGDPSHLSHLSSGLNQLRHQAAFCDITIIVGDQRFPAHKAVLSCASNYFQGMFTSGFQESTMSEITVPGCEESFAQILDFTYTGCFSLSLRTVVGILKMTCYMVLTKAEELCAKYLKDVKDKLTVEDFFEIWSIARNYNSLRDVAQMYGSQVIQNFMKCVISKVFLENSSASVMMEILSDEEIETDTTTEEQILQGTVMWLKHNWEQRKVHAVDLLKKIRLGLVPVDRLQRILGVEIMAIPECKEMVEEVVKLSITKDTASPSLITTRPDLFATRNTITAMLWAEEDCDSMISLKCRTETACYKLTKLADVPDKFPHFDPKDSDTGIAVLVSDTGNLYAAGGNDDWLRISSKPTEIVQDIRKWISENNFFKYNSEKNEWSVLPPMPHVLMYPLMIQCDDYIYAMGESRSAGNIMMERYSISSSTWELIDGDLSLMPTSAVSVNNGQYIFISDYDMNQFAVYKPAKNELLDVDVDANLDRYVIFCDNVCYLVTEGNEQEPKNKVNRCMYDFDSDRPTIVFAEAVEDKSLDLKRSFPPTPFPFTFDKRKLGMIQVPCRCNHLILWKQRVAVEC
ncbi:kelch repeat and BTB domain-containing protein 2-like isoform X2 [Amphiura filiformis]|uniref:kelch repeat and BTB domain-containing protein 2-like isoform X2 n=1 Tax=Amphiura filiformis TaxID=82378 RepID=UPI003B20B731